MTLQGIVPDVPSKRMLLVHLTCLCPVCGGQSKTVRHGGYDMPVRIQCSFCSDGSLFWVDDLVFQLDGIEYYDTRARCFTDSATGNEHYPAYPLIHPTRVNDERRRQGTPVSYGYFKRMRRRDKKGVSVDRSEVAQIE